MLIVEYFFKIIRLGIGIEDYDVFPTLSEKDWDRIIYMSKQQALEGVLFDGICKLPADKKPARETIQKLIKRCLYIEKVNTILNAKVIQTADFFKNNGFHPILLKGQGLAQIYPNPLRRMPGDIDLWLADDRKKIINFVRKLHPESEVLYHHIHIKEQDGLDVEVHMVPSLLFNPFANTRLKYLWEDWGKKCMEIGFKSIDGKVNIPCDEMNRVFLLLHKYRHLFDEGIGLRQMVDYMMLLRKGFTEEERVRTVRILKDLHLTAFCRAVMFVLTDALGMEREYLLMEPDEKAGKLLLNEIIAAGNFGKYDTRIDRTIKGDSLKSFYYRNKRNMRFLRYFPNEALWGFYFKIYNWFLRRKNNKYELQT